MVLFDDFDDVVHLLSLTQANPGEEFSNSSHDFATSV
jgi:hypothetical protein